MERVYLLLVVLTSLVCSVTFSSVRGLLLEGSPLLGSFSGALSIFYVRAFVFKRVLPGLFRAVLRDGHVGGPVVAGEFVVQCQALRLELADRVNRLVLA